MKVKCKSTEGYIFSRKSRKKDLVDIVNYEQLSLGFVYDVYGIMSYNEDIHYLIIDSYGIVGWWSVDFFETVDTEITKNWHYNFFSYDNKETGINFIMGYQKLVEDYEHYVGLAEGEEKDIDLFREINLGDKANKVINEWDPIYLMFDSQEYKYSFEIDLIKKELKKSNDENVIGLKIKEIFVKCFGDEVFKASLEECVDIARKIFN